MRLVVLAAWVAAGVAQADNPWHSLPLVAHRKVETSEPMRTGDVVSTAQVVELAMSPTEATRWVLERLRASHLYVPPVDTRAQLPGAPQLTGFDPATGRSYTAIFVGPAKAKTATVILGTSERRPEAGAHVAPVPERAAHVVTTRNEASALTVFQTPLTGDEVKAFYAEQLPKLGWRAVDTGWARPGETLTLGIQQRGAKVSDVVLQHAWAAPAGAQQVAR